MNQPLTRRDLYELYGILPEQRIEMTAAAAMAQFHRRCSEFELNEMLTLEEQRRNEHLSALLIEEP